MTGADFSMISDRMDMPGAGGGRFESEMQRLERFIGGGGGFESQEVMDIEKKLMETLKENQNLKQENQKLKSNLDERDKKIRELNIRLETRTRHLSNQKEMKEQFGCDMSRIDGSFLTTQEDNRMTLFQQKDGRLSNPELEKLLEQKDEELATLKNKLEILQVELSGKESNFE